MLFLASLIHCVFAVIFFFFHRYIEMSVVIVIWIIFVSKIIPPLDVIRRPKFLKQKVSESDTFEQSLYLSSGILFYTALVGVALGIANVLGLPVDLRLLYYCVFFLTSVIYGIYLLTYPKNPNTFVLFRTHTMIASMVLSLLTMSALFFNLNTIDFLMMINLSLLTTGLAIVIILDRKIPIAVHITTVYFFILSMMCLVAGVVSIFTLDISIILFFILICIALLYLFFPPLLAKMFKQAHFPLISWHFSNCVLACSWAIFGYVFWSLFWGIEYQVLTILLDLFMIFGLWFWVYSAEEENPIFFSGMILALSTFIGYIAFMIFPPIFWVTAATLFVYAGGLLITSRGYKNKIQELILSGGAILFLCASDIVLIVQNNEFQVGDILTFALLFLFQSLIWYVTYEIFHRQSNVKKRAL
ncbi:hypothetical protein KBB89_00870 [Candidatus Gracilibacteria bacterium]|nr:hypothetical protein [Candidatus Gracilibacteria bacterium]